MSESNLGAVQFSFSQGSQASQNTTGDQSVDDALQDIRCVVVTIEDGQGNPIYDQEQIEVFNFSGNLAAVPISLNAGDYQLTGYLALNDNGEVIYATPIEDSEYAHLVNDPLPINFSVVSDQTTQAVPEVIDAQAFIPE